MEKKTSDIKKPCLSYLWKMQNVDSLFAVDYSISERVDGRSILLTGQELIFQQQ